MILETLPVTRRILVAVDGSEFSERAGLFAVSLARVYRAHLTVFHVAKYPSNQLGVGSTHTLSVGLPLSDSVVDKLKQAATAQMERIAVIAKRSGVGVNEEITDSPSPIVSIISDYAYQNSIDLIVVGTRGLSAYKASLAGSVSEGLVREARCGVVVIK